MFGLAGKRKTLRKTDKEQLGRFSSVRASLMGPKPRRNLHLVPKPRRSFHLVPDPAETRSRCQSPAGALTWLVEGVQVWLPLAHVGKRADDGEEVVSLLLVLMVMLLQEDFSDFLPHALVKFAGLVLLVQDHI